MAFCGKCGTPLGEGKFCPKCGAVNESVVNESVVSTSDQTKKGGFAKKATAGVAVIAVLIFIITRFTSTVNEPCDWCGDSPSVAYELSDGSDAYVCKDCSKTCLWCGNKAKKHYENLLGTIVFVCNDCYEEAAGY